MTTGGADASRCVASSLIDGEVRQARIGDDAHSRTSRGARELGNHVRRIVNAFLGSELLPAFVRTRIMRSLGFRLGERVCIWAGCSFRSSDVEMGANVFINVGFFFDGSDRLIIGDDVRIGQFVKIITGSHAIGPTTQRCLIEAVNAPVIIEQGCWIGACVTILPGVTVRKGCVIGAGSVVASTTMPDGLYAGVPARRLKDLPV
jgi:maltose O-acetyltransferase